jgi:hypothetical protein
MFFRHTTHTATLVNSNEAAILTCNKRVGYVLYCVQ